MIWQEWLHGCLCHAEDVACGHSFPGALDVIKSARAHGCIHHIDDSLRGHSRSFSPRYLASSTHSDMYSAKVHSYSTCPETGLCRVMFLSAKPSLDLKNDSIHPTCMNVQAVSRLPPLLYELITRPIRLHKNIQIDVLNVFLNSCKFSPKITEMFLLGNIN